MISNILLSVRLTHFLPSGRYQVAMVPYRGLLPLAPPSCTPSLDRLDLGKHALTFILSKDQSYLSQTEAVCFSSAGGGDCLPEPRGDDR